MMEKLSLRYTKAEGADHQQTSPTETLKELAQLTWPSRVFRLKCRHWAATQSHRSGGEPGKVPAQVNT